MLSVLLVAILIASIEGDMHVNSFVPYPGYTGDKNVQGTVTIYTTGSGSSATHSMTFDLTGLGSDCVAGAADDIANGCGIHIHTGTNCDDASTVGGHYHSSDVEDPWGSIVYVADSTGAANQRTRELEMITGLSESQIAGRVMIVHQLDGGRIACGIIEAEPTPRTLYVNSFVPYPGYTGDKSVQGTVAIYNTGSGTSAKHSMTFALTGVGSDCVAGAADDIANGCGIHIHTGTNCDDASTVGGHYHSSDVEDPWGAIVYVADSAGVARVTTVSLEMITGLSASQIEGRVMIVHQLDGGRIACGIIEAEPTPQTLYVNSFVPYPGYTGNRNVQGTVVISSRGSGTSATHSMTFDLTGLGSDCVAGAADAIANGCGIHIHTGTNCDDASTVGGHYHASNVADPWGSIVYVADSTGAARVSAADGAVSLDMITGLSGSQIEGRVMIVHQLDGGRIACGIIEAEPTPMTLYVNSFVPYPGYTGNRNVQGTVVISSRGSGTSATHSMTFDLTGLGSDCVAGAADAIANGCGIHIHTGTNCDDASTVGGHYHSSDVADPWGSIVYVADSTGAARVSAADGAVSLEMITGLSGSQIVGRVMIVHQLDGGRIACGIISSAPTSDVSAASRMRGMQAFVGFCSILLGACWM